MDFVVLVVVCLLIWLLVNCGWKKVSCICNGGRNFVVGSMEKVLGIVELCWYVNCIGYWMVSIVVG